ncbi:MAG: outer membrane beta-barrel protein [Chitinivibrionales bacterium]|nr:outer membrane beta-barrel protein [Chitinivibrionales bacterium]
MKLTRINKAILSLSIFMFFTWSGTAYAQGLRDVNFEFGAKAGFITSHITGDGIDVLENQWRGDDAFDVLSDNNFYFVAGGISAKFMLSRNIAIQPEVLYHRSGKRYDAQVGTQVFDDVEIKTDYLTIPVLFKLQIPTAGFLRPNLYAGPHLSIQLNSEVDNLQNVPAGLNLGYLSPFRTEDDADDEIRNLDAGITLGAGVDFKLGPGYLGLEARWMRGFVNVFDTDELTDNAEEVKNSSLLVMAGYSIAIR